MSPANISISICCLFIAFAIVAIVIIAAAEAAASPKQMKKKRNHKIHPNTRLRRKKNMPRNNTVDCGHLVDIYQTLRLQPSQTVVVYKSIFIARTGSRSVDWQDDGVQGQREI